MNLLVDSYVFYEGVYYVIKNVGIDNDTRIKFSNNFQTRIVSEEKEVEGPLTQRN